MHLTWFCMILIGSGYLVTFISSTLGVHQDESNTLLVEFESLEPSGSLMAEESGDTCRLRSSKPFGFDRNNQCKFVRTKPDALLLCGGHESWVDGADQRDFCETKVRPGRLCKASIHFRSESLHKHYLNLTDSFCKTESTSKPIEYIIYLVKNFTVNREAKELSFVSGLNNSNINLIEVILNQTLITSDQLQPLLENNFNIAKKISIGNCSSLTELKALQFYHKNDQPVGHTHNRSKSKAFNPEIFKILTELSISNIYLKNIHSSSIWVGPQMKTLKLLNMQLESLGSSAIMVEDCRKENLTIKMNNCGLRPANLGKDFIFLALAGHNPCPNRTTDLAIDLRSNPFDGYITKESFRFLIKGGYEQNRNFSLLLDNLQCCDKRNEWIFDEFRMAVRSSIKSFCSDIKEFFGTIVDKQSLKQKCLLSAVVTSTLTTPTSTSETLPINGTTSPDPNMSSSSAPYIKYIIVVVALIFITIVFYFCNRYIGHDGYGARRRDRAGSTKRHNHTRSRDQNRDTGEKRLLLNSASSPEYSKSAAKVPKSAQDSLTQSDQAFLTPSEPSPSLLSSNPGLPVSVIEVSAPPISSKTLVQLAAAEGINRNSKESPTSPPSSKPKKAPRKTRKKKSPKSPNSPIAATPPKSPKSRKPKKSPRSPEISIQPPKSPESISYSTRLPKTRKSLQQQLQPQNNTSDDNDAFRKKRRGESDQ